MKFKENRAKSLEKHNHFESSAHQEEQFDQDETRYKAALIVSQKLALNAKKFKGGKNILLFTVPEVADSMNVTNTTMQDKDEGGYATSASSGYDEKTTNQLRKVIFTKCRKDIKNMICGEASPLFRSPRKLQ